MVYLTLDDYATLCAELGGDPDAVTAFNLYATKASQLITRLTHGRVKNEQPVRDAVKYAAYELINAMQADDSHGGREVASVSNDGVSVTYTTAGSANAGGTDPRYLRIVRDWLSSEVSEKGIPLLYAGVDA